MCTEKCTQTNTVNQHQLRLNFVPPDLTTPTINRTLENDGQEQGIFSDYIVNTNSDPTIGFDSSSNISSPLTNRPGYKENDSVHEDTVPVKILRNSILKDEPSPACPRIIHSKPFYLKPFHIRLAEYNARRAEIFNEPTSTVKQARSARRMKNFWNHVKHVRCGLLSTIYDKPNDIRPYADVQLFGETLVGLLDTGASVSCLGAQAAGNFLDSPRDFRKIKSIIRTADGKSQDVVGVVETGITFRGKTRPIRLYIVPNLSQNLYLGIDFWRLFDLLPSGLVSELNSNINTCSVSESTEQRPLTAGQRQQLQCVVNSFPSFAKEGLGRTCVLSHVVDVGTAKPIKQRHFPVSPAMEKLIYAELDRMLEMDVIEESDSAWSSPIVLVRKPGKVRLCLDSRKLNSVTVRDAYPLPNIDGILSRLPRAEYITSLDLKDAFWQIPLDKSSKDKTAFTVPGRPLYHYKVMPFGLCNAPQTMSRLMDKVVPVSLKAEVFVYLDDLLIVSDSFERHLLVLRELARQMRIAGLTINVEKSKFCVREVRYLGHLIGDGIIQTDPDKISPIVEFPVPRSVKQIRRFLGMSGWYRKFIRNYASVTAPLTDLLKSNRKFSWNEEAQKAFEELKTILTTAPVLHSPDFSQPFYIHCDASHTGIGSVLVQKTAEGEEFPIAFMSKKLNQAQRNYSVTEQECLAAMLSIKKFRAYVEGHEFTVITDHASLKWLMSQTDLNSRLARWALKLQGFSFRIEHRKGSQNVVPDALSRVNTEDLSEFLELELSELNECGLFIDLDSEHFKSPAYIELLDKVRASGDVTPDIRIMDGFLYRRTEHCSGEQLQDDLAWKLWVPREMVRVILDKAHGSHQSAHGGIAKTLERIRRFYFWPNLVSDVRDYVNACETCKVTKHPNFVMRPPMGKTTETSRFFQKLYIDFLGPYPRSKSGNIGVFVVLDHFSKFCFLKPIRKFTTDAVIKYIEGELFHTFGTPEIIVSDNGSQFKSKQFNELLGKYGVHHVYTAVYSPQANASERVNRSVLSAIRAYVKNDQSTWDEYLSSINCALRSSLHDSIGTTPYYMAFGQHMITNGKSYELLRRLQMLDDRAVKFNRDDSFDIIRAQAGRNMAKRQQRNERSYNLRSREVSYEVGQEVFRRNFCQSNFERGFNSKLAPTFVKARIRRKIGKSYYELEDLQGKAIGQYHAKDIRQ